VFGFAKTICKIIGGLSLGSFDKDNCLKKGCIGDYSDKECECNTILNYVPCISLTCADQVFAPGCNCTDINNTNAALGSGDSDPSDINGGSLGCWAARTNQEDPKNIQHWTALSFGSKNCGHPGHDVLGAGLTDCFAIQLAEALNMFELDFYNDWINGTLYTYLLKFKKRKGGDKKFCDVDCDSPDSDNGCDKSFFVDTCIDGRDRRLGVKETSKQYIDEGFIKMVTERLPDGRDVDTLYYAPYASNLSQKLFATELIHLGSIFDCDWQGIPKIQPFLIPTTYKRAPYIDEWLIDVNGNNTTVKTACGLTSTGSNGSSGVFFDIDCRGLTVGQINGSPRCDNFKRQCEFGMNIDEGQLSPSNTLLVPSDCYLNDQDLVQPYADRIRDIFYQLNINVGPTKLNSWPAFANGLPSGIETGFGIGVGTTSLVTSTIGQEYKDFRGTSTGQPYWTPSGGKNSGYVQSKNSYYFYFGTMPGQTAVELMNRKYFTTCDVVVKNNFIISGIVDDAETSGVCDGEIGVTVVGGEAPYTYNWTGPNGYTNPSTSIGDIVGLCAGIYNLSVTDSEGGTSTISFTVNEPSAFTCSTTSTNSLTNGGDGELRIQVFGGTPPYLYSINSAPQVTMVGSQEVLPRPAGTYVVTVTDDNGNGSNCTNPSTGATITEPPTLSIQGLTDFGGTTCGDDNGFINISLNSGIGGTPPYNITISGSTVPYGPVSTANNSGLAAGMYDIVVSDSGYNPIISGGTQVDTDTVIIVPSTTPNITYIDNWYCWTYNNPQSQNIYPMFATSADGGFTIEATPRDTNNLPTTPVITQPFNAGTTTAIMTTLHKDSKYDFRLIDDNGCVSTSFGDFIPGNGQVPSAAMRLQYIPEYYCWTDINPEIDPKFRVWVDGPFVITWAGGSQSFTAVPNGTIVTVTNYVASNVTLFTMAETTHNCTVNTPVDILSQTPTSQLAVSISQNANICNTANTSALTATVNGGWGGYSYNWYKDGVSTTAVVSPSITGSDCGTVWVLYITDNQGCQKVSNSITIN